MVKINRKMYLDKVHACWIGKNIGGTMGAPYEGKREMQDIKGFASPKGVVIPNDDLDLQLVWLKAMEEHGPYGLTSQILGEYWISFIPPHWNEYGVGKSNLRAGLLPPLSGEYCNEKWKNSNGAWIRSEIWACLCPGFPEYAVKYAFMDASVDHGVAEGTYAEIFTASIESSAFFENDIHKLIDIGLSYIPESCKLAQTIRLTLDLYNKKVDYRQAREKIVEFNKELGWFQAPANVSFAVLGLLYGECDFKKSMIYAINCGDDTDCTGATVGALLGIMYGTAGIPEDWSSHIGDSIVSVAVDGSMPGKVSNCTELTQRIYELVIPTLKANGTYMEFTEEESELPQKDNNVWYWNDTNRNKMKKPYSYDAPSLIHTKITVEFDEKPQVKPNGSIKVYMRFNNQFDDQRHLHIKLFLPDGWTADYHKSVYITHQADIDTYEKEDVWEATIYIGDNVEPVNRLVAEVSTPGRPTVGYVPIVIMG